MKTFKVIHQKMWWFRKKSLKKKKQEKTTGKPRSRSQSLITQCFPVAFMKNRSTLNTNEIDSKTWLLRKKSIEEKEQRKTRDRSQSLAIPCFKVGPAGPSRRFFSTSEEHELFATIPSRQASVRLVFDIEI